MPTKPLAPKARWLKAHQGNAPGAQSESSRWAELTDQPWFQAQVERVLADLASKWVVSDMQQAAIVGLKLQGAREALNALLNLGEPDAPIIAKRDLTLEAPETLLKRKP